MRPPLTRSPLIISRYANPLNNNYLKEALHSLIEKQAVQKVVVRSSLAFYKQVVPGSKTKQVEINLGSKHIELNKLKAPSKGIRIHQYLDDWLHRAPCQLTYLQNTWPYAKI